MKRPLSCVAALAVLSSSPFALAAFDPSVVRVNVGPEGNYSGYGSGVVVRSKPPIVATCAHVIRNEHDVSVYLPASGRTIQATKIKAIFEHDVAFLLLDPDVISKLPDYAEVDLNHPFKGGPEDHSPPINVMGYNKYRYVEPGGGYIIGPSKVLAELTVGGRRLPGGFSFTVLELGGKNRAEIVRGGDSGAPVFMDGKVVALAAGIVNLSVTNHTSFAVPLVDRVPEPADMQDLPAKLDLSSNNNPYRGLVDSYGVVTQVFSLKTQRSVAAAAGKGRECAGPIGDVFGRNVGRAEAMPERLAGVTADCDAFYGVLREASVTENRNGVTSFVMSQLEASNPVLLEGDAVSEIAFSEAEVDSETKHRASKHPELKKKIDDLLKSVKKEGAKAPAPKRPPQKALSQSEKYARLARDAHEELERLLRAGEIPQAAATKPAAVPEKQPAVEKPKGDLPKHQ